MAKKPNIYEQQITKSISDVSTAISLINRGTAINVNNILLGAELQAQGSLFAASGYRQAADLLGQTTAFNLQVDIINTARTIRDLGEQYRLTNSKQLSQQAATGFAIGSKSFEAVRNETRTLARRQILETKIDAENVRRAKLFESQVQQVNLENQARAQDYQAQVSRVLGQAKANEASFAGTAQKFDLIRNLNKEIGSLFGGRE